MKKILLSLASVALMMSACTQDVAEQESNSFVNFDGNVTVTASMTADTRTAMAENAQGGLDITWVEGDEIGLSAEDDNAWLGTNIKYTANQSAATTGFECADDENSIKWGEGTHYFWAYYPYTEGGDDPLAVPASVPAVQEQSVAGSTDHLQPYSFLYAACEASKTANGGAIELQFKNAFSVLELDVCAEAGSMNCEGLIFRADDEGEIVSAENILVNLEDGDLNYSEATNTSNEILIDLGEGVELNSTTAQKFYMLITPGHGGKRFSFYAVVDGKEVLLGNKGIPAAGLPAGRKAVLSLNIPAVDLSAEGTANCYIANAANTTYKFKATVMGNGDKGLTTGMTQATGISSTAITPASASLVWATGTKEAPLATDVEYKNGYIYFKTPATFVNGNAVIAAKDNSGKTLWSWHIWAVENYDVEANLVTVTSKAVEGDAYATQWIDRNIGALNNNANGDLNAYGMYYQWGRKDPFAIANQVWWADGSRTQAERTLADMGNEIPWTNKGNSGRNTFQDRLQDAIEHPDYYIQGTGSVHNWTSGADLAANDETVAYEWEALWGNPDANWWADANALGSKSIFDPCPIGYRLPANAHYRFISGIQADTWASYADTDPWRWNCVEVENMTPADVGRPQWTNYQRGFNFYIQDHHTGSNSEWTHKALGKTWFFPSAGMAHYNGMMQHGGVDNTNGKDRVALWVNQPVANDSKEASRLTAHYDGTIGGIQYVHVSGNFCSGNACAAPVRCISDNAFINTQAIDLSKDGTSNCYIVNKANTTYKFNATVQGNGKATPGITPATIAPKKAYLLWAQLNPISGSDKTMSKIINKESVQLTKDGYVTFTTAPNMINGNACIAVTDDAGKILWSWHLWCVKGYNANNTAVTVTNTGIKDGFQMMDRNLGASGNGSLKNYDDYSNALGMWYQWGRKDPFLGIKKANGYYTSFHWQTLDGTISEIYTYSGPNYETADLQAMSVDEAVAYTIAHPMTFATGSKSPYKWLDNDTAANTEQATAWNKLWGNISKDRTYGLGKKSIYDPCPVGWRVPEAQCFFFITSHGDDCGEKYTKQTPWKVNTATPIYNKAVGEDETADPIFTKWFTEPYGLEFYMHGQTTADENLMPIAPEDKTVSYFPAGGVLSRTNGKADLYNNYGFYLCNNAYSSHNPRRMMMWTGNGFAVGARYSGDYEQLAHGCQVRCIKE